MFQNRTWLRHSHHTDTLLLSRVSVNQKFNNCNNVTIRLKTRVGSEEFLSWKHTRRFYLIIFTLFLLLLLFTLVVMTCTYLNDHPFLYTHTRMYTHECQHERFVVILGAL